jgi:hypothetical protein
MFVMLKDPSRVLFWNVHSLSGTARQDVVRKHVSSSRVDVLAFGGCKWGNSYCLTGSFGLPQKFQN